MVLTTEYKYKKIVRQCAILAVNFWSVTYFGVFNFDTLHLGAKIGQNFPIYGITEILLKVALSTLILTPFTPA